MKKSVKTVVAGAVICICACAVVTVTEYKKNASLTENSAVTGDVSPADEETEQTELIPETETRESDSVTEQNTTRQPENGYTQSGNEPETVIGSSPYVLTDDGFGVSALLAYNGSYVEDGSDEPVENIAAVKILNSSGNDCRYAEISVQTADKTYEFVISTLKKGESLTVLEKNRQILSGDRAVKKITVSKIAQFDETPVLHEDVFELTVFDGVMNIRNISGTDIDGPVYVYYKNRGEGELFGGITYRITIDSLKAGELKQTSSRHLSKENSVMEFITYVH